jgi:hypothetical protein
MPNGPLVETTTIRRLDRTAGKLIARLAVGCRRRESRRPADPGAGRRYFLKTSFVASKVDISAAIFPFSNT